MPNTSVVFFCDSKGVAPLLTWFERLPVSAQDKCRVRIERLAEEGHELRRPEADYLGRGIYELRAKHLGVNYRMLYFFHARTTAVLSHGLSKQRASIPQRDILAAVTRKALFETNPWRHTFVE